MEYIGIIPARYASTRFPGKPLATIGGIPMIQRVYMQAKKVLDTVVVATDDERIYQTVRSFSGNVVMTSTNHRSGTDRCWEAYCTWNEKQKSKYSNFKPADVIINIQGDEPFVQPEQIQLLMSCFPTDIATLVKPFNKEADINALKNTNRVKVVFSNKSGNALYFSRSVIPYLRGIPEEEWLNNSLFYHHLGMYAYSANVLEEITKLEPSALEKLESLEQLRWLENGYKIKVAVTFAESIGIDTPEDLRQAEEYLKTQEK